MSILSKDKLLLVLQKSKLFFLYFLIFILPFSKAGMEITFILVFLFWLIPKFLLKGIKIKEYLPQTKLTFPVLLFLLVCFLGIFNSVEPKESIRGFFGKWIQWVMIYFIFIDTIDSKRKMTNVLKILSFSFTLILLDGVYQFFVGKDFFRSFPLEGMGWITATLRNLNTFGGFLALVSPVVVFFLIKDLPKISFRLSLYLIILLFLFCLFFSNSASSWIALSTSYILIIFFLKKYKVKYKLWFLTMPLLLIFLVMSQPIFRERITTLPLQISSEGGRFAIWKQFFSEAKKNPILGKGLNTTCTSIIKKYSDSPFFLSGEDNPHNLYLSLFLETGILGLIAYLWLLFGIYRVLFSLSNDMLGYGIFLGITSFLIVNLFDRIWDERIQCLFWVIIGLSVAYSKLKEKKELKLN